LEQGASPVAEREVLNEDQRIRERLVFGMRQIRGVDWGALGALASEPTRQSIEEKIEQHVAQGWIQRDGDWVRLTRRGLVLSDSLWGDYL
jgi:oxygen-independent coproporphyrinogen-3 oxidase